MPARYRVRARRTARSPPQRQRRAGPRPRVAGDPLTPVERQPDRAARPPAARAERRADIEPRRAALRPAPGARADIDLSPAELGSGRAARAMRIDVARHARSRGSRRPVHSLRARSPTDEPAAARRRRPRRARCRRVRRRALRWLGDQTHRQPVGAMRRPAPPSRPRDPQRRWRRARRRDVAGRTHRRPARPPATRRARPAGRRPTAVAARDQPGARRPARAASAARAARAAAARQGWRRIARRGPPVRIGADIVSSMARRSSTGRGEGRARRQARGAPVIADGPLPARSVR